MDENAPIQQPNGSNAGPDSPEPSAPEPKPVDPDPKPAAPKPESEPIRLKPEPAIPELQKDIPLPAQTQPPQEPAPKPAALEHVLPPQPYKLKVLLLLSDFLAILVCVYFFMIRDIIRAISDETFSFLSNRMFAYYAVLIITCVLAGVMLVFKMTHSASTRFIRENQVREDPNAKVWLCGYDWGWPVLFIPTAALMVIAGVIGLVLDLIFGDTSTVNAILGGAVILFASLNAAVVIFKIRPLVLGLLAGGFFILLLILLLHGPGTLLGFFKGFRRLGVQIEPVGFIMLAYIWSIFLRIIWLRSLFFYWVFLPNRLELQHGLSESNDAVDRDDLRLQIDTDDVILRWWNVGIITFYFPQLDRQTITNVVIGIRKKAEYANRIASVKTMQD